MQKGTEAVFLYWTATALLMKNRRVCANVPLKGNYLQTVYTLDKSTSVFHNWVRMGAPIYACYHLLECSCGTLKRGNFDHYEYLMYFNGTNNAATKFVLKDWQIKELGLSHT